VDEKLVFPSHDDEEWGLEFEDAYYDEEHVVLAVWIGRLGTNYDCGEEHQLTVAEEEKLLAWLTARAAARKETK
jgi:hypothetical protein